MKPKDELIRRIIAWSITLAIMLIVYGLLYVVEGM